MTEGRSRTVCQGGGGSGDRCQSDRGRADGWPERVAVVWVIRGAPEKADWRPRTVAGATVSADGFLGNKKAPSSASAAAAGKQGRGWESDRFDWAES